MAGPGWYPDPDGTPGRFRYWTGKAWSERTTFDAAAPAPGGQRRRTTAIAILAGVVALLLIMIVVVVINTNRSNAVREPQVLPDSTVSGWDDSSPFPSESPTDKASVDPVDPKRPVACDQYDLSRPPAQPADGRVHGGPLSFQQLAGDWGRPAANSRFPYSKDAYRQAQTLPEELPWEASAYVGVSTVPDGSDGEQATARLLQCLVTSDFYVSVDAEVTENGARPIKISNTDAVQRDALLRFDHRDLKTTGSRVRIVIVESDPVTFYFHAVPMERDDLIAELDTAAQSLRLG